MENKEEISNLKNRDYKYHLSFVEEGIFNEAYQGWTGGRVEVFIESEVYNIEEIRFFTLQNKDWIDFREKYEGENVDEHTLNNLRATIKERFHSISKN